MYGTGSEKEERVSAGGWFIHWHRFPFNADLNSNFKIT